MNWEEMVIAMALTIIKGVIKNPAKAAELKKELLMIRDDINTLYPGLNPGE